MSQNGTGNLRVGMGWGIFESEPLLEFHQSESVVESFLPSLVGKAKIAITLNRALVEVRTRLVKPGDREYGRIGDLSYKEGEERLEIVVSDTKTNINWKVVERGMWYSKHRIEFPRIQLGNHYGF